MSISVLYAPPSAVPALNPVAIKLNGSRILTPGSKYSIGISFYDFPSNGDTIRFQFSNYDVTLTCKVGADDSGTQIEIINTMLLDEWVDQYFIQRGILANGILNEFFDCTLNTITSTPIVTVVAREVGTLYNLTVTNSLTNASNGLPDLGTNPIVAKNYRIYSYLYVEKEYFSGLFTRVNVQDGIPAEDNSCVFYAEDVIKSFLGSDDPVFNNNVATACVNMHKRFYFRNAEAYGAPLVKKALYPTSISTAFLSGFAKKDFPGNTFLADYIQSTIAKKFLTKRPRIKTVSPTQQEFLYYHANVTGSSTVTLSLKVTNFYDDGTTSTETTVLTKVAYQPQVFIFPAGFEQLDLASINPAKVVVKYNLRIVESSGTYSETMTYKVNYDYFEHSNYLLFQNSLGGFDTVWLTGEPTFTNQTKQETFNSFLEYNFGSSDGEIKTTQKTFVEGITVETGFVNNSKEYISYLQDLLLSRKVYFIAPTKYLRVFIDVKEIDLYNEEDTLFSLPLKLIFSFINKAY